VCGGGSAEGEGGEMSKLWRDGSSVLDTNSLDATGTFFPHEEVVEWLKSISCPITIKVMRCGPESLLLENYTWVDMDGEYVIELRPEDAQRVAGFLAKGG